MKKSNKILYFSLFTLAVILGAFFFSDIFDFGFLASAAGSVPVACAIVPFISLEHDTESCNMAGISTVVYVIRVSDILSFPTVLKTSAEGKVTYQGDFVLKQGKYWDAYYSTQEMAQLKSEVSGPRDGEFFSITGSFFYPNTSKRAVGMANLFKNADVIIIMKEFSGGGQMRVIGSMELPARIKPSEDTGKAFSDQKGITFNIEASSCTPAKIYEGAIVLQNEVLYSSVRMAVDASSVDVFNSKRFVIGANTASIILNNLLNMIPGDIVHLSYDADSDGALTFNGAFGVSATLLKPGEFIVLEKNDKNDIVIIDGLFS